MHQLNLHDKIVLANWKANLSPAGIERWLADFGREYKPVAGIHVVLAVPVFSLEKVSEQCRGFGNVSLAAQDVSPFPPGGYTGAVPAAWLSGLVEFTLVGHRERRLYFRESVQDVANKAREAISAGITPIVCMDSELVLPQVASLDTSERESCIMAYTPYDAAALEVAESPRSAAENADRLLTQAGGGTVLYGGGVNAGNVAGFISLPHLSGVMTAAGCLDPGDFLNLLRNAGKALVDFSG